MEVKKITLMEAYLIETIRNNGETDEGIIEKVKKRNVSAWQSNGNDFDFTPLITLANKDWATFASIIKNGYQIKFLTFNGLKNILHLKFDKKPKSDYEITESGIKQLYVTASEFTILSQIISINWKIVKNPAGSITIQYI